jgi:hypothetical protein
LESLHPSTRATERRRAPRVEVLGQLHGNLVALRMPIVVRDASFGGFSVETSVPFPEGAEHQFRLSTDEGSLLVMARSVHCLRISPARSEPFYITGFEFVATEGVDRSIIDGLVEKLLGAVVAD